MLIPDLAKQPPDTVLRLGQHSLRYRSIFALYCRTRALRALYHFVAFIIQRRGAHLSGGDELWPPLFCGCQHHNEFFAMG